VRRPLMIEPLVRLYKSISEKLNEWSDLPNLIARISIGLVFVNTGWGKLHSLPDVTQYFKSLGLPFPDFQAVMVGSTELVAGSMLILGLFTRLVSLPLAATMVVAIIVAQLPEVKDLFKFVGLIEWAYLLFLVMFIFYGPGKLSLDYLLGKFFTGQNK
ncbi:MAG: DoxX family protein, partial [Candidatus Caenarcaniphilales bacterium]|nr:DoxX family protein [Candidatus Caenarcaniphilales bacterium]